MLSKIAASSQGLRRHSSAPARRASSAASGLSERSTIGVREKWESALRTRQTSNPVIPFISASRKIRSGRSRRTTASASPPPAAACIWHRVRRSIFSAIPRKSPESSTRRMEGMG